MPRSDGTAARLQSAQRVMLRIRMQAVCAMQIASALRADGVDVPTLTTWTADYPEIEPWTE